MPKGRNPWNEARENTDCPWYVALTYDGEMADAADDLEQLLRVLLHAHDPQAGEELVVWENQATVVAVLKAGGTVIRCDQAQTQPATKDRRRR